MGCHRRRHGYGNRQAGHFFDECRKLKLEIPSYFQSSALHKAEIISLFSELLAILKTGSNFNQTHMVETAVLFFLKVVFFAFINFLGTVSC